MKTITKENIHDLQNYLEQEGYTFIVHTFNEKQKYDYIAEYYLRWNANNIKEPIFDIMIRECDGEELPYMVEVIRNVSRIEIERFINKEYSIDSIENHRKKIKGE